MAGNSKRQELKTEIVLTGKTDGSAAQLFKDLAITAESSYNEICKAFQKYDDLQTQAYNRQKKQYNDMLQKQVQLAQAQARQKQQGRNSYVTMWQNLLKEQEDIEKQVAQEQARADKERLQREQERAREKEKRDKFLYQKMQEFQRAAEERERAYAALFDEAERRLEENKLGNRIKKFVSQLSKDMDSLGGKLLGAGWQLNRLGRRLLQTTELYIDFDDAMRATQGKLVTATTQEIEALEEQVRAWAETTRFGAVETASAVKEAASSGWELTEIYEGIPTVMTLAATAGMDLTDAMEYLNSAIAGLNMDMSESATLVDQWVMASNRSRASVQDMGEAMQRLGSLMTFTESSDEVLTLLSVMAEYGTKGAEAGTMLRNVMLRLIAPTKKAAETLDMLDASEEELAELGDMDTGAAAAAMETLGLNVFDAEGNLKSMIQVISELRRATSGMTEEEMYPMLAAIFPTRTLRGIMDLLRTSDEEYTSIQNRIRASGGYASEIAALQEGGIGGSVRSLKSAFEELKLTVAEAMNPQMMKLTDALTQLIRNISDLPESVWDTIGNVLTLLVEAGPILIGVGTGMKIISKLLTPGGAITAGLMLATALLVMLDKQAEERRQRNLENLFGSVTLDVAEMRQEIDKSTGAITEQKAALDELTGDIQQNLTDFTALYEEMTGDLTQYFITGQTLTEDQGKALVTMGTQMGAKVKEGIDLSELHQLNWLDVMFGDPSNEVEANAYTSGVSTATKYYDAIKKQTDGLGVELGNALADALADGIIDADEKNIISAIMAKYAAIENEVTQIYADAAQEKRLLQAGRVTFDSINGFVTEQYTLGEEQKQKALDDLDDEYALLIAQNKHNYDNAKTREERQQILRERDDINAGFAQKSQDIESNANADTNAVLMRAIDTAFDSEGMGEAWGLLKRIGEQGVGLDKLDWNRVLLGMDNSQGAALLRSLYDADKSTGWAMANALDSTGNSSLADILTSLNRYAGALESRSRVDEGFGIYEDLTPDFANDTELQTQAAGDAQTYVNQAQAKLNANQLKIRVDMVMGNNGVKLPASLVGRGLNGYADGGRADTASIFGEAGPEWAIPEKHTARTASLLEAAAKASGFGSLGLTAGGSSSGPATIIYSPVINAQDARGVDGALREDKKRLEKWWNERAARAEAEAFG